MLQNIGLSVMVMSDDDERVTVAHLIDDSTGETLSTGSAKRMPGDKVQSCIGLNLAVARALKKFGTEQERKALELSNHIS